MKWGGGYPRKAKLMRRIPGRINFKQAWPRMLDSRAGHVKLS